MRKTIKHLSNKGYTFAVGDDEGNIVKRTSSYSAIYNAINSLEECYLRVWKGSVKGEGSLGYIYFSGSEIFDHSDNKDIRSIVDLFDQTLF